MVSHRVTLARITRVRLAIEQRGDIGAVLRDEGISIPEWKQMERHLLGELATEIAAGRADLSTQYATEFYGPGAVHTETPQPSEAPVAQSVVAKPSYLLNPTVRPNVPPVVAQPASAPVVVPSPPPRAALVGSSTVLAPMGAAATPATPFRTPPAGALPPAAIRREPAPPRGLVGSGTVLGPTAAPAGPAMPFAGARPAPPNATDKGSAPAVSQPAKALVGASTVFAPLDSAVGPATPFRAPPPASSSPASIKRDPSAPGSSAPVGSGTVLAPTGVPAGPATPFQAAQPAPISAPSDVPNLSVELYAWVSAKLKRTPPEQLPAMLAQLKLTPESRARLDHEWRERLKTDPSLNMQYSVAYARHLEQIIATEAKPGGPNPKR